MIDQNGKRRLHKKLPCEIKPLLRLLKPHRKSIELIAVETT